jgi:uncharacterized protein (TIGR02145 family)
VDILGPCFFIVIIQGLKITCMKTKLFRKLIPIVEGLGGGLLLLLFPLALSAQITISDFSAQVADGSPATLTFKLKWTPLDNKVWSDTVWVFVDYNTAGAMTRLPLVLNEGGNTLTATSAPGVGQVEEVSGNTNGVWVVGNARSLAPGSAFSATVQLLAAATATLQGACVYAINYPPLGKYTAFDKITFTGTPDFVLTLDDETPITLARVNPPYTYTVNPDNPVESFTDASKAPGVFKCKTPNTYTLIASATSYCAGSASATFALSGTEAGATYLLYKGATPAATLTGDGKPGTFSDTHKAGTYSVQTVASQAFCAATVTDMREIVEVLPPKPSITVSASTVCQNAALTFYVNPPIPGAVYTWTASTGTVNGSSYTFDTGAAGARTATVTASTTTGGLTCVSTASVAATATVVAYPIISKQPRNSIICSNTTARLDVAASPVTAYQWYKGSASVTEGSNYTTAAYTTANLTAAATYSVVVSNGACAVTSNPAAVSMSTVTQCCGGTYTKPDATVNFTAFSPCSATEVGIAWYLTDTRESNNVQTYKVRKMPNNTIWMVQDMKFGNLCDDTFTPSSDADQQGKVTSTNLAHYGDCYVSGLPGDIYLYEWAATTNRARSYALNTPYPDECATPCQGVCPAGWMIPDIAAFTTLANGLKTTLGVGTLDAAFHDNTLWESIYTIESTAGLWRPEYYGNNWNTNGSMSYNRGVGYESGVWDIGRWIGPAMPLPVRCLRY